MLPDLQINDDATLTRQPAANVAVVPDNAPALRGYKLEKRIGSGGSGEVWKAIAPDGRPKAVKIIFGWLDERRATQEMKALNRVRTLRHEFLLSLESIEIADGRVVIVTDLADSSLRDRFEECRSAGGAGIPHAELMNYLFETAAALDYLGNDCGLQHLDIKPENLLLLSGHVKVADFGLLKDVTEGNCSLINGLTPKYAAPELFDGKPNRHSDQYSLAIVFQEMTTGTSPFSGRTAAQLASQHLHSMPDLTSLSPLERFAVGKALAKDPAMRFGSCREFVDRLVPRSRTKLLMTGAPRSDANDRPRAGSRPPEEVRRHDGQTVEVRAPESIRLPAINLEAARPNHRPALFLGIGHVGGRILNRLKHLLLERFGLEKNLSAFQLLYIDTDVEAVREVTAVACGGKLSEAETLLLPIHSTWNYRNSAVSQIGSISRRWLYNIPRSQKTEGMRALGRLAFLDHAERVKTGIRKAILSACEREAIESTAEATGLPFGSCDPRVFVIASPGGGTGSGMLIDAAYAVRQLLVETGFSDDEVIGILPFVTRQSQTGAGLAPANALACLQELRHYNIAGNYPGEAACGLAGFCEKSPTFAHTYFLDLGEHLAEDAFAEETNKVASYILLNAVTPASAFFDAARKNDDDPDSDFTVRTFALESLGADAHDLSAPLIDRICRTVVLNWRGYGAADAAARSGRSKDRNSAADRHANEAFIHRIASSHAMEIGLDFRLLYKAIIRLIDVDGRTNTNSLVNGVVAESLGSTADDRSGGDVSLAPALQKIHQFFGVQLAPEAESRSENDTFREMLLELAHRHGRQFGESLEEWILSLVDRMECRIAGSQQVADWLHGRMGTLVAEGIAQTKAARQSREQLLAALNTGSKTAGVAPGSNGTSIANTLRQYTHLLLQELASEAVLKCLDVTDSSVLRSSDRLRDSWKDLNRLADEFGSARTQSRPDTPEGLLEQAALAPDGFTPATIGEITNDVADEIERSFFRKQCSLRGILSQSGHLRPQLVVTLRETANKAVRKTSRQMIVSRLNEAIQKGDEPRIDRIFGKCLASLRSAADRYGGATRLLLSLPNQTFSERLAARSRTLLDDDPTLTCDPEGEMIAAYELEQVPLEIVTNRLIRSKPDCEALASRLHTRTDVQFTY